MNTTAAPVSQPSQQPRSAPAAANRPAEAAVPAARTVPAAETQPQAEATELGRSAAAAIANQVTEQEESEQEERAAIEAAVSTVKEYIKIVERDLDFEVDEITGRTLVRVTDPETGQLVRQIPPEEVVAVAHALREIEDSLASQQAAVGVLTGLLVREQA